MIAYPKVGEWYYAEKTGGGVINDTVFTMNQMIEEYLNIDITYTHIPSGVGSGPAIYNKIEPSFMAGDDDYQLCMFAAFYSYYNRSTMTLGRRNSDPGSVP